MIHYKKRAFSNAEKVNFSKQDRNRVWICFCLEVRSLLYYIGFLPLSCLINRSNFTCFSNDYLVIPKLWDTKVMIVSRFFRFFRRNNQVCLSKKIKILIFDLKIKQIQHIGLSLKLFFIITKKLRIFKIKINLALMLTKEIDLFTFLNLSHISWI